MRTHWIVWTYSRILSTVSTLPPEFVLLLLGDGDDSDRFEALWTFTVLVGEEESDGSHFLDIEERERRKA